MFGMTSALLGVLACTQSEGAVVAIGTSESELLVRSQEPLDPLSLQLLGRLHEASLELLETWLDSSSPVVRARTDETNVSLKRVEVEVGNSYYIEALAGSRLDEVGFSVNDVPGYCTPGDPSKVYLVQTTFDPGHPASSSLKYVDPQIAAHEFAHVLLCSAAPEHLELPKQIVEALTELVALSLLRGAGFDAEARASERSVESGIFRYGLSDLDQFAGPERAFRASRHASRLTSAVMTPLLYLPGEPRRSTWLTVYVLESLLAEVDERSRMAGAADSATNPGLRAPPFLLLLETLLEITRGPDPTTTLFQRLAAALRARLEADGAPRYRGDGELIATEADGYILQSTWLYPLLSINGATVLFESLPPLGPGAGRATIEVNWFGGSPALLFRRSDGSRSEEFLFLVVTPRGPVLRELRWTGPLARVITLPKLELAAEVTQLQWTSLELEFVAGQVTHASLGGATFAQADMLPGARLIGVAIDGDGYLSLRSVD